MNPDSMPSMRALPVVPLTGELDVEDFDDRRSADELLAETDAKTAAMVVVDRGESPEEAKRLVSDVFEVRRRLTPHVIEDYAIDCAMARIVGAEVTPFIVPNATSDEKKWETFVLRSALHAWTLWAASNIEQAVTAISSLRRQQHVSERVETASGAINLMSLYLWAGAIEALARNDRAEARRLWKRALELGTTHGTKSSLLIQWTYVGSFFPN